MDDISPQVEADIRNNQGNRHINDKWASDSNRYDMTQGSIGEPDLDTGNSYIQNRIKNLLIDCINQGADGFRFDAAKHIEIPSSAEYIIFNNGNGNQSNDIKLEGTNKIYENGSWRDFS